MGKGNKGKGRKTKEKQKTIKMEEMERVRNGDDNKVKTLYLCFGEYKMDGWVSYVIHAIRLNEDMMSSSVAPGPATAHVGCLRQVGYICGKGLPVHMGCGVFGSKIVLTGGEQGIYDGVGAWGFAPFPAKDVYVLETDDPNPNIINQPNYDVFNCSPLRCGKCGPIIAEHDGKLYVLSTYPLLFAGIPMTPSFELFDPKDGTWKTLPEPPSFEPFYRQRGLQRFLSYLILGSNIFVWSGLDRHPVFRFDMADDSTPEWKPHSFNNVDLARLPLEFGPQSLAVECLGGDWVIFNRDSDNRLVVYLMSRDLKILKPLAPLELPREYFDPPKHALYRTTFFHLGGQKVGLVGAVDVSGRKLLPAEHTIWEKPWEVDDSSSDGLVVGFERNIDIEHQAEDELTRNINIDLVIFEFELLESRDALALQRLHSSYRFTYNANRPSEHRNTEVEMIRALLL